jgi:hypothetical protein
MYAICVIGAHISCTCSLIFCIRTLTVRDRPFNLKGGVMVFWFVQKKNFGQHESWNINFFAAQSANFFFQNTTLGYMTKTLNQIIFFSSTKIRIFFSATLGIRIFFYRKTITPPFKLNGRSLSCSICPLCVLLENLTFTCVFEPYKGIIMTS